MLSVFLLVLNIVQQKIHLFILSKKNFVFVIVVMYFKLSSDLYITTNQFINFHGKP